MCASNTSHIFKNNPYHLPFFLGSVCVRVYVYKCVNFFPPLPSSPVHEMKEEFAHNSIPIA